MLLLEVFFFHHLPQLVNLFLLLQYGIEQVRTLIFLPLLFLVLHIRS